MPKKPLPTEIKAALIGGCAIIIAACVPLILKNYSTNNPQQISVGGNAVVTSQAFAIGNGVAISKSVAIGGSISPVVLNTNLLK